MNRNTSSLAAVVWLLLLSALATSPANAQTVPLLINYQGKLVSSNGLPMSTGDYELRFRIWDAPTGGNQVWGPQVFNGQSGPGFGPLVPAVQGWFNVMLGPLDTNSLSVANAFADQNRYIEIQIGSNPPVRPRQRMLSAPYAFNALNALRADTADRLRNDRTLGPLILHVKTDGSDANDGFSETQAKRTIKAALESVPDRIEHPVDIAIWPGVYREAVEIRHKLVINPSVAFLRLKGMGATPDAVRISGANAENQPIRSYAVAIEKSPVELFNLTCENGVHLGIHVSCGGELNATRLNIKGRMVGMVVSQMSHALLEDVHIECEGQKGNLAVEVSLNSMIGLRDDHRIPNGDSDIPALIGDPENTVRNTVRNFRAGFALYSWAAVVGIDTALRIIDVDLDFQKQQTVAVTQP